MTVFPFGAVVAACSMMRRNNEKNEKERYEKERSEKEKIVTSPSVIKLTIDDKQTHIDYKIMDDFDWAMAAWTLINICKKNGQIENLAHILEKNEMIVKDEG